jgi:hypothetical protein
MLSIFGDCCVLKTISIVTAMGKKEDNTFLGA